MRDSLQNGRLVVIPLDQMFLFCCHEHHSWIRHHRQFLLQDPSSEHDDVNPHAELLQDFRTTLQHVNTTICPSANNHEKNLLGVAYFLLVLHQFSNDVQCFSGFSPFALVGFDSGDQCL